MKIKINDKAIESADVLDFVRANKVSKIELAADETADKLAGIHKPVLFAKKLSRDEILHIAGIAVGVLGFLL